MRLSLDISKLRQYGPLLLIILIVFLISIFALLFNKSSGLKKPDKVVTKKVDSPPSVLNKSDAETDPRSPVQIKVLNVITLSEYKKGSIEIRDKKVSKATVIVQFNEGGQKNTLEITLIDKIFYSELKVNADGSTQTSAEKLLDVNDLPLTEANYLTLLLAYVPPNSTSTYDSINAFCQITKSTPCEAYSDLGFGKNKIEIDSYLDSFINSGTPIEFDKIAPVLLINNTSL